MRSPHVSDYPAAYEHAELVHSIQAALVDAETARSAVVELARCPEVSVTAHHARVRDALDQAVRALREARARTGRYG